MQFVSAEGFTPFRCSQFCSCAKPPRAPKRHGLLQVRWSARRPTLQQNELFTLVGAARFELTTPCAQGRCATRLRYAPTSPIVAARIVLSLYSSSGRGARATSNSARDSVDPERRVKGAASPKSERRILRRNDWWIRLTPVHCHSTWKFPGRMERYREAVFSPSWLSS